MNDTESSLAEIGFIYQDEFRSILCLDGDLPIANFFKTTLPIIAADGAANTLIKMGVKPALVIGDMDGIDSSLRASLNTLYKPDQNFSDFQKSLTYLTENNLLPAIVLGVNGGYLDHIFNNINLFIGTGSLLYAPPLIGFSLSAGESKNLLLPINSKLSMFGVPAASVTTNGLKWELDHYPIAFPGNTSCFNRTVTHEVSIQVDSGTAFILAYTNY